MAVELFDAVSRATLHPASPHWGYENSRPYNGEDKQYQNGQAPQPLPVLRTVQRPSRPIGDGHAWSSDLSELPAFATRQSYRVVPSGSTPLLTKVSRGARIDQTRLRYRRGRGPRFRGRAGARSRCGRRSSP